MLFGSEKIMQIIGGIKYVESAPVLKILLPAFIFSFYSMLYGWPVLGVIGKIKETTVTTVITSFLQLFGIIILIVGDAFNLINLAVVTSISEIILFVLRFFVYCKNKSLFNLEG